MQQILEPTTIISFDEIIGSALQGLPFTPRPRNEDARPEPCWEEFLTQTVYPLMVRAAHDLNCHARQIALFQEGQGHAGEPSVWRIVRSDSATGSPCAPLHQVILVNDRGPELIDFQEGIVRRHSRGLETTSVPEISWWGAVEALDRYVHEAALAAFPLCQPSGGELLVA